MAERIDRIGQRFDDYVLQRRLGGGSFGDVYLGEQVHEHSLAAVKVLHLRLTRSEDWRAFLNEVRTFRLQHPHIVRVLDVGIAQDETPFLVMAYAPGGTLRDRHPKGSRLSPAQVLGYVLPIASALQYAHDLQLIHRDVKPENLLLGARGELWLSDFGIATVAHSTHSLTAEAMGGTVPYMAPEQIQGRPRPQSDQYALAIVVYEWLTGTWPFRGTAFEIAMQHQMTPPPSLRTHVPELAPEVEQVVLTALAKEPKERFASVLAFARALEQASQAEQSTVVEPMSVPPMPDAKSGVLREERHPTTEEVRVRQAREEKQVGQVKQPERAPVIPVSEMTDTNSSQQPTKMATPALPMPVSQQTVGEVSTDTPTQPQTILPLSSEERLRQTGEVSRQVEEETARQEKEQADTLEEERARKAKETVLAATEGAPSAGQTPLPTEVARASQPSPLRPDALVVVKPAKPGASQRFVLLGLAGLMIVALASGIAWFTAHPASPTAGIQASPTASIPAAPALSITGFPVPTANGGPGVITAGPGGNLWFTEEVYNQQGTLIIGNKIGRISPSGTITEFPLPSAYSELYGLTAGPGGNLWFTDTLGNRIGRITPSGTITGFPLPTNCGEVDLGCSPRDITAGPDGNLWFTEQAGKIGRISPSGTVTEFPLLSAYIDPRGIKAGPDGNLWFTEYGSGKIGRISPSGTITEFPLPDRTNAPAGLTAGPDGNLWFTEAKGNKIGRISPSGTITEFPLPSRCEPSGYCGLDRITAGPDGNLWFTENSGNKIGRISPSGTITEFPLPAAYGEPYGITAGPGGTLWFTGYGKIGRFTPGK